MAYFLLPEGFFVSWVNGDDGNEHLIFMYVIVYQVGEFFNGSAADIIIADGGKEGVALDGIKGKL